MEWAEELTRSFEAGISLLMTNGKGVLAQVAQAVSKAEADNDVRAIILTGAGRAFCAGYDLAGAYAGLGDDPTLMLNAPVPAAKKVLAKAGLTFDDIDLFEVNEAFSSVLGAWEQELQPDPERVNVNGGAIALGHPIGCSGARIIVTLIHEMKRRGVRYGVAAMCIGGGQGIGCLIENKN